MRIHMGTSFKVWNRRHIWFWLVHDLNGNGGTVGSAATERDAVREACISIEEMATKHVPFLDSGGANAVRALTQKYSSTAALGCLDSWMNAAYQLTDRMLTGWAGLVLRSS